MKETGIVRRIDELGRIVIPKEIRKTLKLKVGTPLEIFTDHDQLIFKKYSPLVSLESCGEDIVETLKLLTEKTVIMTDCEKVIAVSGKKAFGFQDKTISKDLEKIMNERKSVILNESDGAKIIWLVEGENERCYSQLIIPILAAGDILGSLIIVGFEIGDKITDYDLRPARFSAELIKRQFE